MTTTSYPYESWASGDIGDTENSDLHKDRPIPYPVTMLVRMTCPNCGSDRWATQNFMMGCSGCPDEWRFRSDETTGQISADLVTGDL